MADDDPEATRREPQTLADLLIDWRERDARTLRAEWATYAGRWLERKWGADPICPYCKGIDWSVSSEPVHVASWISTRAFPALQVICATCGHFVLVAASAVKVLEDKANE